MISLLWAFVFSLSSPSLSARQASRRQFIWPRRGDFEGLGAPVSQTLIVLSRDPDTILVPSGENATDLMLLLWALVFSLNSSSLAARQASRRQFIWPRRGDFEGSRRTGIPDFDRPVVGSGNDLGPVRGKRHRHDYPAVGIRLLAELLQFDCQTSQQASVFAKEGRF